MHWCDSVFVERFWCGFEYEVVCFYAYDCVKNVKLGLEKIFKVLQFYDGLHLSLS